MACASLSFAFSSESCKLDGEAVAATGVPTEREVVEAPDPRCGESPMMASIDSAKIVAMFADDLVAQKIVLGMMEGVRGEELQRSSGLDKIEFESKRKKIRRRIEKLGGE